jgi:hypothetical protein
MENQIGRWKKKKRKKKKERGNLVLHTSVHY